MFERKRNRSFPARLLANVRAGRMQKTLGLAAAAAAPPLAFEIYLEHEKGSFSDPWMWTPIVLAPPLTVVPNVMNIWRRIGVMALEISVEAAITSTVVSLTSASFCSSD